MVGCSMPDEPRLRRALVEVLGCSCGHQWEQVRDASGFVLEECPECGRYRKSRDLVQVEILDIDEDDDAFVSAGVISEEAVREKAKELARQRHAQIHADQDRGEDGAAASSD